MLGKMLYFDFALVLLDMIVIRALRKFLFDFILTKKNKQRIAEQHAEQPLKSRITMNYIKPLVRRYADAFASFQRVYALTLVTLLPQYLVVIMCNVLLGANSIFVVIAFSFIKIILWFVIRIHQDANGVSIYRS